MNNSLFSITHTSKISGSRARTGTIRTHHGTIKTPAFVPVATKGALKSLTPAQAQDMSVQVSFVNAYHLVVHPSTAVVRAHGSIHEYARMPWPLFSDSGGFQVFSLAQKARRGKLRDGEESILVSLTQEQVVFRSVYDGELITFSPELSMQYQIDIGADMIMAFDECTYYPATHAYTAQALRRTHEWLKRCVVYKNKNKRPDYPQYLYGVVQGGCFEDLRVESAQFVGEQDVDGIAIGGVSVGESKQEMREQVRWVQAHVPHKKPVHLLGVGHTDDILDLVHYGIDTFDCVEPTRLARMGVLLTASNTHESAHRWRWEKIDITSMMYKNDTNHIVSPSQYVGQFTYSYLHHLFKQKELLGYTIATMHNVATMEHLMTRIREDIQNDYI